ncbi:polyprenyl synthetase family protein [Fusobacterium sp.]|uniref:polyprenyl synthetase family protein n=1 Tax=Fusobacterium sp. TaxID=68766 RepID=UPI00260AEEB1|nr:farnesyl diphosphate synthase [Fusobacterium sp.]
MLLKEYLETGKKLVESGIDKYLSELSYPEVIAEGMKYAVLNGGKRLRPILHFMTLEILGCKKEMGLATASAIEMIHSYSLVHDDLPALDNDDYRRGKLTTHKKFGEAQGILIGDALLTHAFYVLTEKNSELSPEKIVEIVKLTSSYAGINGMIGGQMVDIESEGKKISLETLKYMHANKTGKLLRLPVETACVIAGAMKEDRDVLLKYSELVGLAFQIKDDILDIEGDFESIGKPVGSDLEHDKSTYPSILGMEKSKELLKETIESAKTIIVDRFGAEKGRVLLELAEYIGDRNK